MVTSFWHYNKKNIDFQLEFNTSSIIHLDNKLMKLRQTTWETGFQKRERTYQISYREAQMISDKIHLINTLKSDLLCALATGTVNPGNVELISWVDKPCFLSVCLAVSDMCWPSLYLPNAPPNSSRVISEPGKVLKACETSPFLQENTCKTPSRSPTAT